MTTRNHHVARRPLLRRGMVTLGIPMIAGCLESLPESITVTMGGVIFEPEEAAVAVGGTVGWTNESEVDHTVTAYGDDVPPDGEYFASGGFPDERTARNNVGAGLVAPGETYEHRFENPGTYEYFCIPHENAGMTGIVQVGEE